MRTIPNRREQIEHSSAWDDMGVDISSQIKASDWLSERIKANYGVHSLQRAFDKIKSAGNASYRRYDTLRIAVSRWPHKTKSSASHRLARLAGFPDADTLRAAFQTHAEMRFMPAGMVSEQDLAYLSQMHEERESHGEAIKTLRALHDLCGNAPTLQRSEYRRRLGTQYRHAGELNEALEWYTLAKRDLTDLEADK